VAHLVQEFAYFCLYDVRGKSPASVITISHLPGTDIQLFWLRAAQETLLGARNASNNLGWLPAWPARL